MQDREFAVTRLMTGAIYLPPHDTLFSFVAPAAHVTDTLPSAPSGCVPASTL
jgi:hypothetical protein